MPSTIRNLHLAALAASTLETFGFELTQVELLPTEASFTGKGFGAITLALGPKTAKHAKITLHMGDHALVFEDREDEDLEMCIVRVVGKLFQFWTNPPTIFGNYANIQEAKLQAERKGFRPTAWKRPDSSTYHLL